MDSSPRKSERITFRNCRGCGGITTKWVKVRDDIWVCCGDKDKRIQGCGAEVRLVGRHTQG